jgi:hypothetical protein
MELKRFEKSFSKLTNLFRTKGFYKNPNRFEIDVFGKIADYQLQVLIITGRLEEDISFDRANTKYVFDCLRDGKDINDEEMKKGILNHVKLNLDLFDFFIYTRLFLDALTIGIKLSFITAGNKNACIMEHTMSCLLNNNKLQTYKNKIDLHFFSGLEKHLSWIATLKDSRDGLLHQQNYFVYTNTRQGELGYGIMDREKVEWGTDTVKPILAEVQTVINEVTDLIKYLNNNLPRKEIAKTKSILKQY